MSDHSLPPYAGAHSPAPESAPVPPAQSAPGLPAPPAAQTPPAQPTQQPVPPQQHLYAQQQYAQQHYTQQQHQQPYAQPYQQYQVGPYAAPAQPSSGLALTAMILGIAGIVVSPTIPLVLVTILLPIAAVVLSHIALSTLKRTPGVRGRGMAITGLILGYVPIALSLLLLAGIVIMTLSFGAFTLPFLFAS